MTSYHVSHESYRPQGPPPPIMEAPPPPYPQTGPRYQEYYGGHGQLHPPPLHPYRSDEYYREGEYVGCFPFLRTCLTTLCCCWFVERCCLPSRY